MNAAANAAGLGAPRRAGCRRGDSRRVRLWTRAQRARDDSAGRDDARRRGVAVARARDLVRARLSSLRIAPRERPRHSRRHVPVPPQRELELRARRAAGRQGARPHRHDPRRFFARADRVARSRPSSARTHDSIVAAGRDSGLLHSLDLSTPTLEGYLFPDTYVFPDGTTPRAAVAAMVHRFEQVWKPEWTARLDTIHLSRNDVITLASLVEKEARVPRRASGHRRRLSQPASRRGAAAGRPHGPVRARQARGASVLQGSRGRVAVQHLQAQGSAARADRVAGEAEHRGGALPGKRPIQVLRGLPRRAPRVQRRTWPRTSGRSPRRAERGTRSTSPVDGAGIRFAPNRIHTTLV